MSWELLLTFFPWCNQQSLITFIVWEFFGGFAEIVVLSIDPRKVIFFKKHILQYRKYTKSQFFSRSNWWKDSLQTTHWIKQVHKRHLLSNKTFQLEILENITKNEVAQLSLWLSGLSGGHKIILPSWHFTYVCLTKGSMWVCSLLCSH